MSRVNSVANAAQYYAEDNYYTQQESAERSAWQGLGAAALGLHGDVHPEQFVEVLKGRIDGHELGRIVGRDAATGELQREHRPGYDVTLSPPKSVSLLAEVDGRADVRAAHEAAVDAVLRYMEHNLSYARVTEAGQTRQELTGNLLVARFHHTVSRALDPQTHTHLVVANATLSQDGHWRSLDSKPLYQHQKLLGAIYDTELAANLRVLGYRLAAGPKGNWEIVGFTRAQIEHFSQRAEAVEERLQRFGLSRETATAAQREDAALRTRPPKPEFEHATLRQEWTTRAQDQHVLFGDIERDRARQTERPIDPLAADQSAITAVRFALAHLSERESVMTGVALAEAALTHIRHTAPWSMVTLPHVERATDHVVHAGEALRTASGDLTTPLALERERLMLSLLEKGRGTVLPISADREIRVAVARFEEERTKRDGGPFFLTSGQEAATLLALSTRDRFVALQGYAGTGKTTMLTLVNDIAVARGYDVQGMAASAEAARILQQETGIASRTTADFILQLRQQSAAQQSNRLGVTAAIDLSGKEIRTLSTGLSMSVLAAPRARALWVVDEASLAGQRDVTELMNAAAKVGAQLIFVGDRLQLQAVESGKPFELLLRHGIAFAEMTDINRQQAQDLQEAVAAAVERDNVRALAYVQDRIIEVPSKAKLHETIARDIVTMSAAARQETLVIVPLNADRKAINTLVRAELQNQGLIGRNEHAATVLVRTDLTGPQRGHAAYFADGMQIRFNRAYRPLDIARGDYARVKDVHHAGGTVLIEPMGRASVLWRPETRARVEPYATEVRQIAIGDAIRFTRNNSELGVRNGTTGVVKEISGDRMAVQVGERQVELALGRPAHQHWDYAYAMTVYAAQGHTARQTHFLITKDSGKAMGERSFYVGITRPRQDMRIYTDSTAAATRLVSKAQHKTSAIDGTATDARGQSDGARRGPARGADLER